MAKEVEVKMLKLAAGPSGVFPIGSKRWLSPDEAKKLVDDGAGELTGNTRQAGNTGQATVKGKGRQIKTATVNPPENAALGQEGEGDNAESSSA